MGGFFYGKGGEFKMTEGNGGFGEKPAEIIEAVTSNGRDGLPWSDNDLDTIAHAVADSRYGIDLDPDSYHGIVKEPVFETATKRPEVRRGWSVDNRNV